MMKAFIALPHILQNVVRGLLLFNVFIYVRDLGTASVVQWSDFLAADSEVPGSIPGAARFSE
jgi:hypothetical protein